MSAGTPMRFAERSWRPKLSRSHRSAAASHNTARAYVVCTRYGKTRSVRLPAKTHGHFGKKRHETHVDRCVTDVVEWEKNPSTYALTNRNHFHATVSGRELINARRTCERASPASVLTPANVLDAYLVANVNEISRCLRKDDYRARRPCPALRDICNNIGPGSCRVPCAHAVNAHGGLF